MNGCGGEQSYGFVKKKLSCFLKCHTTSEYIGMVIKENAEHINYKFIYHTDGQSLFCTLREPKTLTKHMRSLYELLQHNS